MTPSLSPFWRDRLVASGIHMSISLLIAALAAALVFGLWYPGFYRELSGGRELFFLLVSVDVVLGPLITLAVFNRAKPARELRRDICVVALIQLSALSYGLWTVCVARPVHLVFEYDRYRVVNAFEVDKDSIERAPSGITPLPLTGPTVLSLRRLTDLKQKADATSLEMSGRSMATLPEYWQAFESELPRALWAAKPVSELKQRFPLRAREIDRLLDASGQDATGLLYLPLLSRNVYWTAFVNPQSAKIVAILELDPY